MGNRRKEERREVEGRGRGGMKREDRECGRTKVGYDNGEGLGRKGRKKREDKEEKQKEIGQKEEWRSN